MKFLFTIDELGGHLTDARRAHRRVKRHLCKMAANREYIEASMKALSPAEADELREMAKVDGDLAWLVEPGGPLGEVSP